MSGGDKSGRLLAGTGKTTPLRELKAACEQMGHALRIIEERKSALLVAPTWVEIEAVASHVRAELKARERLGKEEYEFRVFDCFSH